MLSRVGKSMEKESLTIEEIGMAARCVSAMIRELEASIDDMEMVVELGLDPEEYKARIQKDLEEYKILQEKFMRMFKFN